MRGTHDVEFVTRHRHRFIPAHAGNTWGHQSNSGKSSVHPRACGEHSAESWPPPGSTGSSPRMRGTPRAEAASLPGDRFIPAHAGNTCRPRIRRVVYSGSSPRMRGTPLGQIGELEIGRFIPAHAGNTFSTFTLLLASAVHPRACGEHIRRRTSRDRVSGSSPRMRGTLDSQRQPAIYRRFIPAHAGNTSGQSDTAQANSVHPRACGEHSAISCCVRPASGSSPRMRGTRLCFLSQICQSRFIPAHAGNTGERKQGGSPVTVHPRACGEHSLVAFLAATIFGSSPRMRGTQTKLQHHRPRIRFIPAHAGNTAASSAAQAILTVHPRACGEHLVDLALLLERLGSSPRMRGTRFSAALREHVIRFIPAHAGNTPARPVRSETCSVHPRACGEHWPSSTRIVLVLGSSPRMRGTRP